jgi:hypothetical protein
MLIFLRSIEFVEKSEKKKKNNKLKFYFFLYLDYFNLK